MMLNLVSLNTEILVESRTETQFLSHTHDKLGANNLSNPSSSSPINTTGTSTPRLPAASPTPTCNALLLPNVNPCAASFHAL